MNIKYILSKVRKGISILRVQHCTHMKMIIIAITVTLPTTPSMTYMVLCGTRRSFTSGEGVGDEISRELIEVSSDGTSGEEEIVSCIKHPQHQHVVLISPNLV